MTKESPISIRDISRTEFVGDDRLVLTLHTELRNLYTGNHILFGDTSEGRKVVVKSFPLQRGANREWDGLQRAFTAQVSVPEPISIGKDGDSRPCIVMERVCGERIVKRDDVELRFQAGGLLRSVHDKILVDQSEWGEKGLGDFTHYERSSSNGLQVVKSFRDVSMIESLIGEFLAPTAGEIDGTETVFIHNDLHDGQIINSPERGLVLIDFENWREGYPVEDISTYILHSLRQGRPIEGFKEFVKGYRLGKAMSESEKNCLAFFIILAGIRAVDFLSKFRIKDIEFGLKQLDEIMAFVESEYIWENF